MQVGPPVFTLNCTAWTHSEHLCAPNPLLKTTTMLAATAQKLQKILLFAKKQIIFPCSMSSAPGDQGAESQPPHYKLPPAPQHHCSISAPKQAEK